MSFTDVQLRGTIRLTRKGLEKLRWLLSIMSTTGTLMLPCWLLMCVSCDIYGRHKLMIDTAPGYMRQELRLPIPPPNKHERIPQ